MTKVWSNHRDEGKAAHGKAIRELVDANEALDARVEELETLLVALREAFEPVADWYGAENENGPPPTFLNMLKDAVADLALDRQEAIRARRYLTERDALAAQVKELREGGEDAKRRLDNYADRAWRSEVDTDGRSWKRQIWGAFSYFDKALSSTPPQDPLGEARNAALEEAAEVAENAKGKLIEHSLEGDVRHVATAKDVAQAIRSLKGEVSANE